MADKIQKTLYKIQKEEQRHLKRAPVGEKLTQRVKIPDGLRATLTTAFTKGFTVVFDRGTGLIEKTYDRALLQAEFLVRDAQTGAHPTRRHLRALDKRARKVRLAGSGITLAEGVGLGVLGIGLLDIPLFLAGLLRGIYQTALSYGFPYDTEGERVYILRLLACAAAPSEMRQKQLDDLAQTFNAGEVPLLDLEIAVQDAAESLADLMLVAKFVQGLPIVGAAGGGLNLPVYRRILSYAALSYRKRYLWRKQQESK